MDQSIDKLVMTQQGSEGMEFVLEKANVTLGRATINEIVLLHDSKGRNSVPTAVSLPSLSSVTELRR